MARFEASGFDIAQRSGGLSHGHSLQGLIKWLSREEWREEFEALLDRHLSPWFEWLPGALATSWAPCTLAR